MWLSELVVNLNLFSSVLSVLFLFSLEGYALLIDHMDDSDVFVRHFLIEQLQSARSNDRQVAYRIANC